MDKNKEVITGLFRIKDWANFGLTHRWMMDDGYEKMKEYADNAIALLKAMDVTPEELERLKKCRHECKIDCLLEHYEKIKAERDALLKAQEPKWTPITFRALTEKEKAEHPDWCYIIDSPTPDDGDEILVSDGDNVWADVWCNNGEWCSLESDHELEDVAWMKMPTPWRKEANT